MTKGRNSHDTIKGGSTEWLESLLYDRWERLRRNRHYIEFCEKLKFSKDGLEEPYQRNSEIDKILEQFNLQYIFHPSTDIHRDEILSYEIFKEPLAVVFEYPESQHPEAEQSHHSMEITHTDDGSEVVIFAGSHSVEISPIWNEHYIKIKIDIGPNRTTEEILDEVREFIEGAREVAGIDRKNIRHRFDKNTIHYKVWDLRRARRSFPEIGKLVGISTDLARKHFCTAYKLINNEQYEPAALGLIQEIKLWGAQKEPSLFNEAYINQDHVKRKEWHVLDEGLLVDLEADPLASTIARLTIENLQTLCMECPDKQCFEHFQDALSSGDQGKWTPCEDAIDIYKNG